MKRKLVAACCTVAFVGIGSISAYAAVDAYEYNQASGFLGEIGIEARELSRKEAKAVYKDIASDTYEYEKTMDLLNEKAQDLGMENIPEDGKAIYEAIVHYHALVGTGKITSAQLRSLPSGLTYQEIIKILGDTKDIGSGQHVLQYAVDGDKVLYLSFADENDICNQSGEDLIKTLESKPQNHLDQNTFNATMTQRMDHSILVSCPTYERFDVISLAITKDTRIEFKDGSLASIDDIDSTSNLVITISPNIDESYPPQGLALKIIINK